MKHAIAALLPLFLLATQSPRAATKDLGHGFSDHGVATRGVRVRASPGRKAFRPPFVLLLPCALAGGHSEKQNCSDPFSSPTNHKVIHKQDTIAKFNLTTSEQGPRVFVTDGKGGFFILFVKSIARLDPKTFEIVMLAQSPVHIDGGGDYLDGRIYFLRGSHLYSYTLNAGRERK